MADALTIQPLVQSRTLSGTSGIVPATTQGQRSTVATAASSTPAGSSSGQVDLSDRGLLLSAVFSLRNDLQALSATSTESPSSRVLATAQALTDTFNGLQAVTANQSSLVAALTDTTPAATFPLTADALATSPLASLVNLQDIGIALQTTSASPTLQIDPAQLLAAIDTDPTATQTVLSGASQSLIDLAANLETQLVNAPATLTGPPLLSVPPGPVIDLDTLPGLPTTPAAPAAPGVGVPVDLLQNLPADAIANATAVTDLDLAAAGVDTETLLTNPAVVREPETVTGELLTPAQAPTLVGETPADTDRASATERPAASTAPAPPTAPAAAPPLAIATTTTPAAPATANAAGVQGPINVPAADVLAAERRASAASIALQNLLANPALRAIDNHFDPAFSALIAAAHLSDFVPPDLGAVNTAALANDELAPVLPATTARGLFYYNEVAGQTWKQFTADWERMQWFA